MSSERAYALQGEAARLREGRSERGFGYEVGCTSRAVQDQLRIREPIFGRVFDTGCVPSGSRLGLDRFASLGIEGELAIRLAADLPQGPFSDQEAIKVIESVFPVIELHHYVIPEQGNPAAALIASGGLHSGLVLPERETRCSGRPPVMDELDLTINNRLDGTTGEPWTTGGLAATLRWLAACLAGWDLQLRRGQVVLTGSALPLFRVGPGSRVVAGPARPAEVVSTSIDSGTISGV